MDNVIRCTHPTESLDVAFIKIGEGNCLKDLQYVCRDMEQWSLRQAVLTVQRAGRQPCIPYGDIAIEFVCGYYDYYQIILFKIQPSIVLDTLLAS